MKEMTCAQIGGPDTCDTKLTGNTADEMIMNAGMPHVMESHPELFADIKKMSSEETTEWMESFKKKFEATPEA